MKKMFLKIEDLEERIAPGLVVDLSGTAAGGASDASDGAGTGGDIDSRGDAHDVAANTGAVGT